MYGRIGNSVIRGTGLALLLFVGWVGQNALPFRHSQGRPDRSAPPARELARAHAVRPIFKADGYTIGKTFVSSGGFNYVPGGDGARVRDPHQEQQVTGPETGLTSSAIQRNNSMVFSGGSLFLAKETNDYVGGFIQWTTTTSRPTPTERWGGTAASTTRTSARSTIARPPPTQRYPNGSSA